VAAIQSERRIRALAALDADGKTADLTTGSPCLFCLKTLGKMPWSASSASPDVALYRKPGDAAAMNG
jgi:hypothetical protein